MHLYSRNSDLESKSTKSESPTPKRRPSPTPSMLSKIAKIPSAAMGHHHHHHHHLHRDSKSSTKSSNEDGNNTFWPIFMATGHSAHIKKPLPPFVTHPKSRKLTRQKTLGNFDTEATGLSTQYRYMTSRADVNSVLDME
jgi:hypothetical protein